MAADKDLSRIYMNVYLGVIRCYAMLDYSVFEHHYVYKHAHYQQIIRLIYLWFSEWILSNIQRTIHRVNSCCLFFVEKNILICFFIVEMYAWPHLNLSVLVLLDHIHLVVLRN